MPRYVFRCLAALAAALVGACGHGERPPVAPASIIYSPNAEPLSGGTFGRPTCEEAMAGWFDRLGGGAGGLSRAAFLADARAQFARMDLNHDGWVTTEELVRFRAPYEPPVPHNTHGPRGAEGGGGPSGGRAPRAPQSPQYQQQSDPVMSADTSLQFRVSEAAFLAQAETVFARLNGTRDGALNRAEAIAACPRDKR